MNLYRFFSNLIYLRARVGVSAALRWLQPGSTDSHGGTRHLQNPVREQDSLQPGREHGPVIFTGAVILLSLVMGGSVITHVAADVLQM